MDDMGECALGKLEVTDIPLDQTKARISANVRHLGREGLWITTQAEKFRAKAKFLIGIGKCLKQPDAEEASGSRDENPLAAQLLPEGPSMRQHMLQVCFGEWFIHKG